MTPSGFRDSQRVQVPNAGLQFYGLGCLGFGL